MPLSPSIEREKKIASYSILNKQLRGNGENCMLDYALIDIGTAQLAYRVFGDKKISVVIEMGLGACLGEWWHIADQMATSHTVLLYERAGCGTSSKSELPRTPHNIAVELFTLLQQFPHEEQLIIVAHSQGGLYANQFARSYPGMVKALILLDPLSANDNAFKITLSPKEYRKSGVDKFSNLNIQLLLAKLHLGGIIKKMMKNSPPFYYYDFTAQAEQYILSTLTRSCFYETAMEEYQYAHDDKMLSLLKNRDGFPDKPIYLITHTSEAAVNETMEYGNTSSELAWKIENLWQCLMREYLDFSNKATFTQAKNSSHYIHLTAPELIFQALNSCQTWLV